MSTAVGPNDGLGALLKRAQHAFRTRIDDALRPLALTAPQYAALAAIGSADGVSNAELARIAFVTPQTMQGILANLERAGFLTRSSHAQHGRILCNALTDRGRDGLRQAQLLVAEIEAMLSVAVGPGNAEPFAGMLSRCAELLGAGWPSEGRAELN